MQQICALTSIKLSMPCGRAILPVASEFGEVVDVVQLEPASTRVMPLASLYPVRFRAPCRTDNQTECDLGGQTVCGPFRPEPVSPSWSRFLLASQHARSVIRRWQITQRVGISTEMMFRFNEEAS
jgi:hypothetical protein